MAAAASHTFDAIVVGTGYTVRPSTRHWFVNDLDPYTETKRFVRMRGYHVGGPSIMWGRRCYRWSDLEPWYDHVERFIGIGGRAGNLPHLPDSRFMPPTELNCVEEVLRDSMREKFGRTLTIGRVGDGRTWPL